MSQHPSETRDLTGFEARLFDDLVDRLAINPWGERGPIVVSIGTVELTAAANNDVLWWVSGKTWTAVRGVRGRPTITYWNVTDLCCDFIEIAYPE